MPDDLPLSVWLTAQPIAPQTAAQYVEGSSAYPYALHPGVARQAIRAYTSPGDMVMDPMCGIGTAIVEAMHLGREAVGLTEAGWRRTAAANIRLATKRGAAGSGRLTTGDWPLLDPELAGHVRLVITSPPRHACFDGQLSATMSACTTYLCAGGIAVICTRPWRHAGTIFDAPNAVAQMAQDLGLVVLERNVALLTGLRDDAIQVPLNASRTRRAGRRLHILAHLDVMVLRKP